MNKTWIPHTPDWVTTPASQIDDLHWLAYHRARQAPWAVGILTALAWVRGGRVAPTTERPEQPVTRPIAEAERWAAEAAQHPDLPLYDICTELGVAHYPPQPNMNGHYAVGVWRTLGWLLNPGEKPPLALPRRHPDGRVYTADDLYAEATRGDDSHFGPERRRAIWHRSGTEAAHYRHLIEQITETQELLTQVS